MVRKVGIDVVADSAQYERAFAKAGASTEVLAKEMDKAAKESEQLARATLAARTATLDAAKASETAARAQDKQAIAAKKAAKAQAEAAAASKLAADAAQKLERGEIAEEQAKKLQADAARKDRTAQLEDAAAQKAAADAAEKLEKASIKAGLAQLAQAKAAREARDAAARSAVQAVEQSFGTRLARTLFGGLVKDANVAGQEAGKVFGDSFAGSVQGVSFDLGALLAPAIVGAVVGSAPFVTAALGGALIAGVGAAGIGAGIAGQMHSPQVTSAWKAFAAEGKSVLADVTSSMAGPLADVASIFGHELELISGDLHTFFDNLAPAIDSLAQGLADFTSNISTELPALSQSLEPILNAIANDLPIVALAITQFMADLTYDTKGAAEGIGALAAAFSLALRFIGSVIATAEVAVDKFFTGLKAVAEVMRLIPGPFQKVAGELVNGINRISDTSPRAAFGLDMFAGSAGRAKTEADRLKASVKAMSDQFDSFLNDALAASNADIAFRDALSRVNQAVRQNGTSLDVHTAKGRKNISMFNDLIAKAEADRQAMIANGNGTVASMAKADAAFDKNIAAIRRQAASAGFSKSQIDKLLRQLHLIPAHKDFTVKAKGADGVLRTLKSVNYYLDSLHDTQFTVTEYYQQKGGGQAGHASSSLGGGGSFKADGGILEFYANGGIRDPQHIAQIVPAGTYRVFGEKETGGEAYLPLAESKRARSMEIYNEVGRRFGVSPEILVPATQVSVSMPVTIPIEIGGEVVRVVRTEIRESHHQIRRGAGAGTGRR